MVGHTFLEIIGIAHESRWEKVRDFLKFVLTHTLDEENNGYELTADSRNLEDPDQQAIISVLADIAFLDTITAFDNISLVQFTEHRRDQITVTKEGPYIVVIAKYVGMTPHKAYFDFSVNLNIINNPQFIHNDGSEITYSDLISKLASLSKKSLSVIDQWERSKELRKKTTLTLEHRVFEKVTRNKSIEDGQEHPNFQLWRKKTAEAYQSKSGKKAYIKNDPTKGYEEYLITIMAESIKSSKKKAVKKPVPTEPLTEEELKRISLESRVYELVKGRSAYSKKGELTRLFDAWSDKTAAEYRDWTGGKAHFKGGMTKGYEDHLLELEKEY